MRASRRSMNTAPSINIQDLCRERRRNREDGPKGLHAVHVCSRLGGCKVQETKNGPEHLFSAAKARSVSPEACENIEAHREKVRGVFSMADADGKLLVDFAVDGGNLQAVISLSSALLQGAGVLVKVTGEY